MHHTRVLRFRLGQDSADRKSVAGYIFIFASRPITWRSKKQDVVAQSTAEPENIALALAVKEALWIRKLSQLDKTVDKIFNI